MLASRILKMWLIKYPNTEARKPIIAPNRRIIKSSFKAIDYLSAFLLIHDFYFVFSVFDFDFSSFSYIEVFKDLSQKKQNSEG